MKVDLSEAARYLCEESQPVAIPTETVWGLAAPANDEACIQKIFFLKGRPFTNPLIIHVSDPSDICAYTEQFPPGFLDLTKAFWPGPLTLVIPILEETILPIVRAGLPTAAFRQPDHSATLKLIEMTGPLVAPSANRSGSPSAVTPKHIEHDFGTWLPILNSRNFCRHGIESTILVWKDSSWFLGRYGAVQHKAIAKVLGYMPIPCVDMRENPLCPGQLHRHYAPKAQLVLSDKPWEATNASQYDGVLGFSDYEYPKARNVVIMGELSKPRSVYKKLYSALREVDQHYCSKVFVDVHSIRSTYDWMPLLDRLHKASSR